MRYYIIDGMNLIHKNARLKKMLKNDVNHAQSSLKFEILSILINRPRNHFTIVFDGTGSPEILNNLSIEFSGSISADELIKNKIKESPNPRKLYVVSSDNEVYNYARLYAADCLTSEDFIKQFFANNPDNKSTLKSKKYKKDKSEKPTHVSKSEIEEMKKLFKK